MYSPKKNTRNRISIKNIHPKGEKRCFCTLKCLEMSSNLMVNIIKTIP